MMKRVRPRLTYANVVSTLALIFAVGGGTTAIAISAKAPKNSVTSNSIRAGHVTARDLAGLKTRVVTQVGGTVRAECRKGERLISGGGTGVSSRPSGNGWETVSAGAGGPVTAFAICLPSKPQKQGPRPG